MPARGCGGYPYPGSPRRQHVGLPPCAASLLRERWASRLNSTLFNCESVRMTPAGDGSSLQTPKAASAGRIAVATLTRVRRASGHTRMKVIHSRGGMAAVKGSARGASLLCAATNLSQRSSLVTWKPVRSDNPLQDRKVPFPSSCEGLDALAFSGSRVAQAAARRHGRINRFRFGRTPIPERRSQDGAGHSGAATAEAA